MAFFLNETLTLLKNTVRDFAQQEIAPIAQTIDQEDHFPIELWKKMGDLGLLGMTIKPEYSGSDMGYLAHCLVMEELSRASGSVGLAYAAHSNLCVNQIHLHGNPAQKQKYLPKLCSGDWIGALAMSEAGSGSDVFSMKLKATPDPKNPEKNYILSGNKMWITNGPSADIIVTYARTDFNPELKSSQGITSFITEKNRANPNQKTFLTAQKLDKLGMRGCETSELIFNQHAIPIQNILGTVNQGQKVLMSGLNYERLILAAGPVGILQACLDLVIPYVKQRKQFGKPLSHFQLIQAHLADLYTELQAARNLLYGAAQYADQTGSLPNEVAASVILYTAERATQGALKAIQLLGGNGYINEYPAGRLLRDAKLYEIGAGTSEIRRLIIGRALTQ